MKKLLLVSVFSTSCLFLSCSTEEDITAKEPDFNKAGFAEGFASGLKDLDIDFTKLFEYTTTQEAKDKTDKAIALIIRDAREELAKRPDCTHLSVVFFITSGKGTLQAVSFFDKDQKVYKEHNAITKAGIRPYTHLIDNSTKVYVQHEESLSKNYVNLITKNQIYNFLENKLTDNGFSQLEVQVEKNGNAKVYGYNES